MKIANFLKKEKIQDYLLRLKIAKKLEFLPGHYYSPIVMPEELKPYEEKLFKIEKNKLFGIELNEDRQLNLLNELKKYYSEVPFTYNKDERFRYYYDNPFFSYNSGIQLFTILRHFKPARIIEIGSGFSSAVMLDTNQYYFDNNIKCIFIDPNPERLLSLLNNDDLQNHKVYGEKIQDVDTSIFNDLEHNDLLFIDSGHVSKTGSDLNHIVFNILPYLKQGVIVHFHDIFYPFEYPKNWAMNSAGFGWNENYLLRAFLINNADFEIIFFNSFMEAFHKDWFETNMPDVYKRQGGSLYLRKIR